MLVTIQFRRGTSAEWATADPVLGQGEPGFDTTVRGQKIGDGASHWSELSWGGPDVGPILYSDLPAGATLTVVFSGSWPDRPTDRLDISVWWADPTGIGGVPPTAEPGVDYVIALLDA